jgi:hypothetical protein
MHLLRFCNRLGLILTCLLLATNSHAARLAARETNEWVPVSQQITDNVVAGYPGKTAGVTVDPTTGDVYLVVPDQGIWKSSDQGKSFERVDRGTVGGRCEGGFSLDMAPNGKGLMCFMVYGPSAMGTDGAKTWNASKTTNLDFGSVDWQSGGKCLIALRHETGGQLCYSSDEGKTWTNLDKGFTAVGIFDEKTLVASKGSGLLRSDNSGQAWEHVSDADLAGRTMRVNKDVGYWTTDRGLLVSKDQGKTWNIEGAAVSAVFGPFFGKDTSHMVVVGKQGFHETTDGGKTWHNVAALPQDFTVDTAGPSYAWDPKANVFYASSPGKDTLKFTRPTSE